MIFCFLSFFLLKKGKDLTIREKSSVNDKINKKKERRINPTSNKNPICSQMRSFVVTSWELTKLFGFNKEKVIFGNNIGS